MHLDFYGILPLIWVTRATIIFLSAFIPGNMIDGTVPDLLEQSMAQMDGKDFELGIVFVFGTSEKKDYLVET